MFLKINSYEVTIKGRGCLDWRKQRNWISKEDTSLPIVSNKCLMISCMIDTMEVQDVANDDIPVALLQTYYNKGDMHINMEE